MRRLTFVLTLLAFRDRNAGSANNQRKPLDEVARPAARGGRGARDQGGKETRVAKIVTVTITVPVF